MGFALLPEMARQSALAKLRQQQPAPAPIQMPWARPANLGPGPVAKRPSQIMQMFAPTQGGSPNMVGPDPRAWRTRAGGIGNG